MNNGSRYQKVIDIIQWVMIILLTAVCIGIFLYRDTYLKNYRADTISRTDSTYIKIYESQKIADLERENRRLYDSIRVLKDVESAVEIKYIYKYKTDTIRVNQFVQNEDSVYSYRNDNDTVLTEVKIKAKELEWCDVNARINDKFTVITKEKDGEVQTNITHSPNVSITDTDMWHRKKTFKDRFHFGPSIGFGYGVNSESFDMFVGFTITYDL